MVLNYFLQTESEENNNLTLEDLKSAKRLTPYLNLARKKAIFLKKILTMWQSVVFFNTSPPEQVT